MTIRRAAVSGKFYPSSKTQLREEIEGYLLRARGADTLPPVNMLIAPHAGYVFSGAVAARGYARVSKDIKTVFITGPSHYRMFNGAHISAARSFETPLGETELNINIVNKLKENPLCRTVAGADENEHSLEVQLPFLQVLLDGFTIVPILTGKLDPSVLADLLLPFMDDTVLVVASTDLSHFYEQSKARAVDDESIRSIMSERGGGFIDGCGETAVRVVMELARRLELSPLLLDARTSYETAPQYGDPDRVVGYASIVYVNKEAKRKVNDNE